MLNGLWAFMMIAGIIYGSFNGNIQAVTEAAFQSAGEAVSLCITMLGIMSFWTGILKIGERAGVIEALTRKMTTPTGLKAMEDLKELEEERRSADPMYARSVPEGTASGEMCTFLIINISSLQLIPVNMIAYRSQYGSRVPMAIVGPALVITLATTLVAVVFCRGKQGCGVLTRGKQDEETCERRVQNIKIPERELRIDGTPRGGRL